MSTPLEKTSDNIYNSNKKNFDDSLISPSVNRARESSLTGSICYIGLGSNLGDRRQNLRLATDKINQLKDTKVTKTSSIIETEPVGGPPQGRFLNAAIEIQTQFSPQELLANLQNIEQELGRARTIKNGPRTIDLDILFYNNKEIKEKDLIVPHPKILEREFVLTPLREIAPHIVKKLQHENNQKN